jgi:signal transduction histidine kinase
VDSLLVISLTAFGVGGALSFFLGVFFIIKGPKKILHLLFALFCFCLTAIVISHMYGVTEVYDGVLSRSILMVHLAVIFAGVFQVNLYLALLKKIYDRVIPLVILYIAGSVLTGYFILNSHSFLHTSELKLYFPNYYVAGDTFYMALWFLVATSIWILVELLFEFRRSGEVERNRICFMILSLVGVNALWATLYPLFYNTTSNPIPSAFFAVGLLPLAYVIFRYEVEPFWKMIKRALLYVLWIVCITILFTVSNLLNTFLLLGFPYFPNWILPLLSGVSFVALGFFLWQKMHESEALKYEFITVVTHKFRTPLTYVKWSVDDLIKKEKSKEEKDSALEQISMAEGKLRELASQLSDLVKVEGVEYMYHFEKKNLGEVMHTAFSAMQERIAAKGIIAHIEDGTRLMARLDVSRLLFVFQILIENAVMYTPRGGTLTLSLAKHGSDALITVTDSGIGIEKDEMIKMFTKFFRSSRARSADTEGMGIGLYMASSIIHRHKGELWAESAGAGKGTTFFIKMPLL